MKRLKTVYSSRHLLVQSQNRNTGKMCEICSKLTIKTPERRHWRRSGVCIVNFEQVNAGWDGIVLLVSTLHLVSTNCFFESTI